MSLSACHAIYNVKVHGEYCDDIESFILIKNPKHFKNK